MNKLILVAGGAVVVAVGSAIVSVVALVREKTARKDLEKGLGAVEKMAAEDISEAVIQRAVEKAADKKVDRYMADTEDAVLRTARKDLEIHARNAVVNAASEIRESTSTEIARQVAMLDIEQLKKRVCDQAEKHVVEKFDHCLDNSLKKFQDQLDNTRKIYDGIARAMAEKEEKKDETTGFRVVMF